MVTVVYVLSYSTVLIKHTIAHVVKLKELYTYGSFRIRFKHLSLLGNMFFFHNSFALQHSPFVVPVSETIFDVLILSVVYASLGHLISLPCKR